MQKIPNRKAPTIKSDIKKDKNNYIKLKKLLFILFTALLFSLFAYKLIHQKITDRQMQVVSIPENMTAGKVQGKLIPVSVDKKYGYINLNYENVIPLEWDYVSNIDRFGYIKTADIEKGIICIFDKSGKKIMEKKDLADIIPLEKDIFILKDKSGNMKLSDTERYIYPISFAVIKDIGDNQLLIGKAVELKEEDKKNEENKSEALKNGVVDFNVKEKEVSKVLDIKYDGITKIDKDKFIVRLYNRFYLINTEDKNKEPISTVLNDQIVFLDKENMGFIKEIDGKEKYYFTDYQGETKGIYDYMSRFYNDKAVIKKNDKYGAVNREGEIILPVKYKFLAPAGTDIFIFKENDKYGYIDDKGKILIPAQYDEATSFYNDRAMFTDNESDIVKIIDRKGKIINKRDYTVVSEIKNNVSIGGTEEGFGAVNQDGKEILKPEYDDMKFWGSSYILGTVKDKIYIFDYEGENLLEINKNEIKRMYNNQINTKDKIYLFKEI